MSRHESDPDARAGASELADWVLRERPSLTAAELVEEAHTSRALAGRLWRALGFPDVGEERAFTHADREAISLLTSLVDSGDLDVDTAVRLTRAVGQTMARLADWQVSTLSASADGDVPSTGPPSLRAVEPVFEQLLTYAWRRHLAAAVGRVEALGTDPDLHTVTLTVGFADLVRFTRLSTGVGEDRLADLVESFESMCADLVAGRGGQLIKTIGDSVLFIAEEPRTGVDIAADIVTSIGAVPDLPDVHVGIATGPVILRLGDVFGAPVNLASRLTGVARRNRVVCDGATADALSVNQGYVVRSLTERLVRGIGSVRPYTVRRR